MKKTVLLSLAVMASYILAEAQFVVTPKVARQSRCLATFRFRPMPTTHRGL